MTVRLDGELKDIDIVANEFAGSLKGLCAITYQEDKRIVIPYDEKSTSYVIGEDNLGADSGYRITKQNLPEHAWKQATGKIYLS